MSFDPTLEYGNEVSSDGCGSGKEYIEAVFEDARKTLPAGTEFSFIAWNEGDTRKVGWVYNLLAPRDKQKLFNPLKNAVLKT
jgi:hypothetical protein